MRPRIASSKKEEQLLRRRATYVRVGHDVMIQRGNKLIMAWSMEDHQPEGVGLDELDMLVGVWIVI